MPYNALIRFQYFLTTDPVPAKKKKTGLTKQESPFANWFSPTNKETRYYPRAGQRGIKIYSTHEIASSKGLENLRRSHWNSKAEELCNDAKFTKWSILEISGVIETVWTLKKTALLKNEAEKVEAEAEKSKKIKQKKNTVVHNINRVLQSHKQVLVLNGQLSGEKGSKKSKKLEKQLSAEITELKSAQESLRKAIEVKKTQLGV